MGNCFQSAAGMSPSRSKEETGSGGSGDGGLGGRVLEPKLRVFSLADLRAATQDFRPDGVLGEGGFGRVYKGCIHDEHSLNATRSSAGIAVAVKKLNAASNQGLREWQTEVDFLGGLEHPNLVRLLGHCCEDRNLLLVYEYMPKGSLEKHLFRRAVEPPSWQMRMNVAIGAARGLAFLHGRDIIYRDFKASNILLDADYRAKLSDFGLARSGPTTGKTHVTTRVVGTHGYAAPEYMATGHLYVKSDVYSFGVVLVELLTGLRTYDHSRPTNQVNLVPWAQPYLAGKRKIQGIVDKRLGGQFPLKAAVGVATLAEECLRRDHTDRPSMEQVVGRLEKLAT